MKELLRAELQVLANLFRVPQGRRTVYFSVAALIYFMGLSHMLTNSLFDTPELGQALRSEDGPVLLPILMGLCFLPVAILVLVSAFKTGEKLLFSGKEMEFLMASPATPAALLARAWLRLLFLNLLWGAAISLPMIGTLYGKAGVGLGLRPLLALALSLVLLASPIVALVLVLHVLVMRFLAGPRVKLALGVLSAVMTLGVVAMALIGGLGDEDLLQDWMSRRVDQFQANPSFPGFLAFVEPPSRLLAWGAGADLGAGGVLMLLAMLLGGPLAVLLASPLYLRAFENDRVASAPLIRKRGPRPAGQSGRWPAGVAASVLRKDIVTMLRQPKQLFGFFIFTALMVWICNNAMVAKMMDPASWYESGSKALERALMVPETYRHTMGMLTMIAWVMLMTVPGLAMAMVAGEKKQWDLLAASPASPKAVLHGKAAFLFLHLGYYLLANLILVRVFFGVQPLAMVCFAVLGLAAAYGIVGLASAICTVPGLAPTAKSETGQVVRSVFCAGFALGLIVLAAVPVGMVWGEVTHFFKDGRGALRGLGAGKLPWVLPLGFLLYALVIGRIGFTAAGANFRRLTGPANE